MNVATSVMGDNSTVAIAVRPSRRSASAFAEARRPLGFRGGLSNLTDYVGDDPTNATDPNGLDPWTKDDVKKMLSEAKGGDEILKELDKITVYRVEFIKYEYKKRDNEGAEWPKAWKTGYVNGLELDANATPDKKVNILIPDKTIDTFDPKKEPPDLTDMRTASAVMAIVHEVVHAKQDPKKPLKTREIEAFKEQVNFIINNPNIMKELPAREQGFYREFIKKVDEKEVPNEEAITKHWEAAYAKFRVVGEAKAERTTLEIVKKSEQEWDTGDPDKKKQLKDWK